MADTRKPGPAPDGWEPRDAPDRSERGGTSGVGAFRRGGRDDPQPPRQPADPRRETRGEPLFGWNPEGSDGNPRSDAAFRTEIADGPLQPQSGDVEPTIDPSHAEGRGAAVEGGQAQMPPPTPEMGWGGPGEPYPPTRGPLDTVGPPPDAPDFTPDRDPAPRGDTSGRR